jgi:hypothetical protein
MPMEFRYPITWKRIDSVHGYKKRSFMFVFLHKKINTCLTQLSYLKKRNGMECHENPT